jgi:membrane associated rhomboid family serine protease
MSSTLIVIALTALVSWSAWQQPRLLERLLFWSPAVTRGRQYERFVSYGFVHGDFQHLLFNMVTLYFFGRLIENFINQQIGEFGFVLFYVTALIVSILPSWLRHRHDPNYRSSGGLGCGLGGVVRLHPAAALVDDHRLRAAGARDLCTRCSTSATASTCSELGQDNINHSAHLWGAVYGVTFIIAMQPRVLTHFLSQLGLG